MSERIRTLHILTSLNRRGAETFAVQLVDRLSRERFDPAIWTIQPPQPGPFLVPQNTEVLSQEGLPNGGGFSRIVRQLVGALKTYHPDLVHCHGGDALKYAMAAKPFWRPRAYVYTKIGSVHPWLDPPLKRAVFGLLFEQIDAIVAVGERIREEVVTTFHPRRPELLTIHTGRDVLPFASVTKEVVAQKRAELKLRSDDICVMTVGSLSWEKDPSTLLEIARELLPRHPYLKFVFVGGGPLATELQEQIARAGLQDRVVCLGIRSDVPALLSAADIFVLPSITEGLPGVLIEAGMAGIPAVAYGVGSVADVLKDGLTGFVVPPGDKASFARRLAELGEEAGLRTKMGKQAMAFCRRDFDINQSVKRHQDLFLRLLRSKDRPGLRRNGQRP